MFPGCRNGRRRRHRLRLQRNCDQGQSVRQASCAKGWRAATYSLTAGDRPSAPEEPAFLRRTVRSSPLLLQCLGRARGQDPFAARYPHAAGWQRSARRWPASCAPLPEADRAYRAACSPLTRTGTPRAPVAMCHQTLNMQPAAQPLVQTNPSSQTRLLDPEPHNVDHAEPLIPNDATA